MTARRPRHFFTALAVTALALLAVVGLAPRAGQPLPRTANRQTPMEGAGRTARPTWRALALGPILVWLAMLLVLGGSSGSAFLHLQRFGPAAGLGAAALMLLLLGIFLMDLKNAGAVIRLIVGAGLFWAIFLFTLTFTDYLSRRPTPATPPAPETGQGAPRGTGSPQRSE